MKSISKYLTESDCWDDETTPALTTVREQASACLLGDTIYVACGVDDDWEQLSTIECLNTRDPQAEWRLIKTEGDELFPCQLPTMVPLNEDEIVLFSGGEPYVYLIGTQTGICKILSSESGFRSFA